MQASDPTAHPVFEPKFRPVIGIVGGIGSGKSEVARAFGAVGCEVCTSDDLARRVLAEPAVISEITAMLSATSSAPSSETSSETSSNVRAADGSIDRAALARAIFASTDIRHRVERVMHPRIEALRRAQFAAAPASTTGFVIDAPLLLEVGLERECDAVVFVEAPLPLRIDRVARSRGWSSEELLRRESAQLSLDEKRGRATDVLVNDGTPAELFARVQVLLDAIKARGPRVSVGPQALANEAHPT